MFIASSLTLKLSFVDNSLFTAFLGKNGRSKIYQITSKITDGILDDVKFTREVRQIWQEMKRVVKIWTKLAIFAEIGHIVYSS